MRARKDQKLPHMHDVLREAALLLESKDEAVRAQAAAAFALLTLCGRVETLTDWVEHLAREGR